MEVQASQPLHKILAEADVESKLILFMKHICIAGNPDAYVIFKDFDTEQSRSNRSF
jgi:hypothetical protein